MQSFNAFKQIPMLHCPVVAPRGLLGAWLETIRVIVSIAINEYNDLIVLPNPIVIGEPILSRLCDSWTMFTPIDVTINTVGMEN